MSYISQVMSIRFWCMYQRAVSLKRSLVFPVSQRQDWMVDPMEAIFGGVTRDQIREQKKKESGVEEEEKKSVIEQVSLQELEFKKQMN